MRYLPHTRQEIEQMLETVGVSSIDALFEDIPEEARYVGPLDVPPPLAEPQLMSHLRGLAALNTAPDMCSFLGAGSYAHHVPPAVDQLLLRSEFYTAYTPYQPEVAQGTLQAIWEFQTMVSELYGLPLANASLYDGASAAAEGVLMARRLTRRPQVIVSECVHPAYRQVINTYAHGDGGDVVQIPVTDAGRDVAALRSAITPETACVLVGYPSFRGDVEAFEELSKIVHDHGALLVTSTTEPYSLGVAESPGAMGADIATGEGLALASPHNFGGPALGLFACREDRKYLQQLPGRVCGETVDKSGKRGFVLTLSTREQHIRRERATSNICTNQGLIALAMTIRLSLLGKSGFEETARVCLSKAEYLKARVRELAAFDVVNTQPTFNEFVFRHETLTADAVAAQMQRQGILAGLSLKRFGGGDERELLCAVTELHSRELLDQFVAALSQIRA